MSRVVLFGATGYTGRLTADAMVARGMRPVLAARSRDPLERMADELGGLESAVADVSEPATVTALTERGDVLVSTVGPFLRFGSAAAAAASTKGAHYLDSTGEPPFIREVFERYGYVASKSECAMVTAFGYDFVPGNLAGALALRDAGESAARVDAGYFWTGSASTNAVSGGTRASLLGVVTEPGFAWREGRLQTERGARHVRSFPVEGKERAGVSIGASEHLALPQSFPNLQEVNVYLGWFGPASRVMPFASAASSAAMKLPGASKLWDSARGRLAKGSTGGPDATERAKSGSHIVAAAYDAEGRQLSEVHLSGVNGYEFTGRILAWGAEQAAAGEIHGTGALGPVAAFGLDELRAGCGESGLEASGTAPAKTAAPA